MKILQTELFNKIAKIDDMKDVRGLPRKYRTNETPNSVFQKKLDNEMSGETDDNRERELNDKWLDAFKKQKDKEKQLQTASAFVVEAKNK